MKFSECNARQKKAWINIKNAASDYIFGLVNGCLDNSPDSEEYNDYRQGLEDLNDIIETVYNEAITTIYTGGGGCFSGKGAESQLKDIRFCGKEFLMRVTTYYCKKFQQEALDEINR